MKVMLSIWLDRNLTITANIYCQQLDRLHSSLPLNRALLVNMEDVWLKHDTSRPHFARQNLQKISKLGYEIMSYPAYSPDIAPTDYYVFRFLYHHLKDQIFNT